MTDLNRVLRDPSAVYNTPDDVLKDGSLSRDEKIQVLKQWAFDAYELLVADEENMAGESPSMLNRCKQALHELGAES